MNLYINWINSNCIDNKYTRWYIQICNRGLYRKCPIVYIERHHIVPRSINPIWIKEKENLVALTAKEHFIVHLCLTKMFEQYSKQHYQMMKAVFFFKLSNDDMNRYNSKIYSILKEKYSKLNSKYANRVFSEERNQKISNALRGVPKTPEHIQKSVATRKHNNSYIPWNKNKSVKHITGFQISNALKGTRIGANNTNYGKVHSNEAKKKIGNASRERSKDESYKQNLRTHRSFLWLITTPAGEQFQVLGLTQFAKENCLDASTLRSKGTTKGYTALKLHKFM